MSALRERLRRISRPSWLRPRYFHIAIAAVGLLAFYVAIDRQVVGERLALSMTAADAAAELVRQHLLARGDVRIEKGQLRAGPGRVEDDAELAPSVRKESHFDCAVFEGRRPVATTVTQVKDGRRETLGDASDELVDVVLLRGKEYRGTLTILGRDWLAVIRPLKDKHESIVGMVAAYKDVAEVEADLLSFRLLLGGSLFVLFLAIAFFCAISVGTVAEVARQGEEISRHRDREARFFASISHELRTPVAAIRGLAATLVTSDAPPVSVDPEGLSPSVVGQRIDREAADLLSIINNLLDFTKMRSGKLELLFEDVAVEQVIRRAMTRCGPLIGPKQVKLKADVPPGLTARCDFVKTTQVLMNLVANAIKFTKEGTVTVRARDGLSASLEHANAALSVAGDEAASGRFVEFQVEDTGCGISNDALGKIWEPFQQADAGVSLKYGGTGLGLSIVRGLVEQMGGSVGVRSRVGVGSVFRFTLPAGAPPAAQTPSS